LSASAAAADAATEQDHEQQQHAEEDWHNDEREQIFHYSLTVAAGEAFTTLTVVVGRSTAALGTARSILTTLLRTPAVIYPTHQPFGDVFGGMKS